MMRRFGWVLLASLALAGTAAATELEDEVAWGDSPFGRFSFFAAGGAGLPVGDTAQHFEVGYGATAGVGFRATDRLGLRGDFLITTYSVREDIFGVETSGIRGGHRMQAGTLSGRLELLPRSSRMNVSVLGGAGLYWRQVSIQSVTGVDVVEACRPGAFFCFPTAVPTSDVVGTRHSYDLGLSAGLNVGWSLGWPTRVFVEPRFHFLFGPSIDTPSGPKQGLGYYVPVLLGFNYF